MITASWKLPSSPGGAPGAPDMVKASRLQSQEAPSRSSCARMLPRDFTFCCQTRPTKSSRLKSRRDLPSFASSRSTTICVAIPAWSVPGCQSVSKPRIRCQRVRMSCNVLLKAWPICSAPVTLGGGIMIEKLSARDALAPARNAPALSHSAAIRASAPAGS